MTERTVSPSDPRKLGSPGDVTAFDADTALERTGPGRWRAWAPEHWFVARGPNGGCRQDALRGTGGDGLFYCFAAN